MMPSPGPVLFQPRGKHQSGAFDLPSVLIGVAVVAILAIGVMATIFGVIPWTQDNAAKQELGAIYAAQGSTYARDDQTFKDLSALEGTGLISDLDPESVEITTTDDGKGFIAKVTSDAGNTWFITHENSMPRPWDKSEAPGGHPWASDICTPWVIEELEWVVEGYLEPGALEYVKMMSSKGEGEFDRELLEAWLHKYVATQAAEEEAPSVAEWEAFSSIGGPLFDQLMSGEGNLEKRLADSVTAGCHS